MTAAAIKATYSDYRRVKGRKVLQLIFEVPIEQAPEVHKTFGEPAPDGTMWVAIARLAEEPKPDKPKRSWSELSRAEQAGIACLDEEFGMFLINERRLKMDATLDDVATMVRLICGVNSRAQLDTNKTAAKEWDHLYSDYQMWKRGAAA